MLGALLLLEGQVDWKQEAGRPEELARAARTVLVQRRHLLDPGSASAMVLLLRVLVLLPALLLVRPALELLELLELLPQPALVLQLVQPPWVALAPVLQLAQLVRAALAQ